MLEPQAFSSYLRRRLFFLTLKSMVMPRQTELLLDYFLLMGFLQLMCKT